MAKQKKKGVKHVNPTVPEHHMAHDTGEGNTALNIVFKTMESAAVNTANTQKSS